VARLLDGIMSKEMERYPVMYVGYSCLSPTELWQKLSSFIGLQQINVFSYSQNPLLNNIIATDLRLMMIMTKG
jgi:hypothetical protein